MSRKAPLKTTGVVLSLDEAARIGQRHGDRVEIVGGKDRPWFDWQLRVLKNTCDEIGLLGGKGSGKAQPLTATLMTPYGPKKMGAMNVGDAVSNPDGTFGRVLAIWPRGRMRVYRVTFSDGTSTIVSGDHVWLIRPTSQKLKADRKWADDTSYPNIGMARLYTTDQLRDRVGYSLPSNKDGSVSWSYQVPLTRPVNYLIPGHKPLLDPYVIGALLGDGCLQPHTVAITSFDQEVVSELSTRLGVELRGDSHGRYGIPAKTGVASALNEYKLRAHGSAEKLIPKHYFKQGVDDRFDLAAG
jgi:hypothetical protein